MIELLNCDCYEKLLSMPDASVDLFLQDTPFGVTQNIWDIAPDLTKMWEQWLRVGKDDTPFIFFATQPFCTDLIQSNRKFFRYDLIWYKPLPGGFLNANKMPLRAHEIILVFYKKLPTYNPEKTPALKLRTRDQPNNRTNTNYGKINKEGTNRYENNGMSYPISIIEFSNGGSERLTNQHPTQKNIDLIRYLIRTYSNANDVVFDGYGGSLSCAFAAEIEKRSAIVCELDKDYFIAGKKRFDDHVAKYAPASEIAATSKGELKLF